ncbi:MAG: sugar transferase [Pyrinomonadaceae bacterium]
MQQNPITLQDTSALGPDAEAVAHETLLSSAQTFSWDAVELAVGGDGEEATTTTITTTTVLESLGAPAARLLVHSTSYTGQSERSREFYFFCKRAIDIAGAVLLLVAALPLFVLIALLVKATSGGSVLYRHRRLGLAGKEFDCLKFRTMVAGADEQLKKNKSLRRQFEQSYKLKHDPRITRMGKFLRRTSLDELPQLVHVLRGEMSFVGPRPIVRKELKKYSIYGDKLLSVKPGLSGMWQVCGRSDTTYTQRVMMDMQYIDHRNLSLDLRLMLLTAGAVVRKTGAC